MRDLPALLGVLVDEGAVDAQLVGNGVCVLLGSAVDELLGAHTGMAIDVFLRPHGKVEGKVGKAVLDGVEAVELRALAAQDIHDVVEGGALDLGKEAGVKLHQLVHGVKLQHLPRGVATYVHREAVGIARKYGLPELIGVLLLVERAAHDALENAHEGVGEGPVKVHVAEHCPRILAANRHGGDAVILVHAQAPLVRGAVHVDGGIVGAVDVGLEGILGKVVIRGADVGVPQLVTNKPERPVVIPFSIEVVGHQANAVLLGKVGELVCAIANNNGDVCDPRLVELANLALNEDLAAYAREPLGSPVRDGHKARREASGHDDRVLYAIGLQRLAAKLGDGGT